MNLNLLTRLSRLLYIRQLFRLNRQVDVMEAGLVECKQRVRVDYSTFKTRLWRSIGSPTGLAVGFGAGVILGLSPRPAKRASGERSLAPRLLSLILRLSLSPVVWSWFRSSDTDQPD